MLLDYLREYGLEAPSLEAAFAADPAKTWDLVRGASNNRPDDFDDAVLATCLARFADSPKDGFWMLHNLAASWPDRAAALLGEYVARFGSDPKEAIDAAYYIAVNNAPLFRPALVEAVRRHVPADACRAFLLFQALLFRRPELIGEPEVDAVLAHARLQINQAFAFLREIVKLRPDMTPKCILALFECIVHEPQRALRDEMLMDLVAISRAEHVKASLEERLREPASHGSKRARTLMAILFRERLRARRAELFDALRHASAYTPWVPRTWTPLWDFLLHLVDSSGDAISTASCERFLEGAWQYSHLAPTMAAYERFAARFDLRDLAPVPFPGDAAFLDLAELHGKVRALAERFGTTLDLPPLAEFSGRAEAARRELDVLRSKPPDPRRAARVAALEFRLGCWADPRHAAALADPSLEAGLPPEWRKLLRDERKGLAKKVRDVLDARTASIALEGLEAGARDAYSETLQGILGREIPPGSIDASLLPALLYFRHVEGLRSSRAALARLIEDRIAGRPHDWLRTEPPAAAWADRVKAACDGVRLERWRASFAKRYVYRPANAEAELRHRIREDLRATRGLFKQMGVDPLPDAVPGPLKEALAKVEAERPEGVTPQVLEEIRTNLERVRILEQTPGSDYEGSLDLEVESDPFKILFMGEYGFTSCLSLRGSNGWGAVSNAIDIDKTVAWAKDPGGNVVARRLVALLPEGLVSYRTYTNRPGLALEGFFEDFLDAYAAHVGVPRAKGISPRALLSDRWYDDGPL